MTEQPKDIVLSNNDMHPAEEIAHLKDLLGKANALARIRAERIKELEAQAGAEPVAWMYFDSDGDAIFGHPHGYRPEDAVPVYTHPPARVPLTEEEIVAVRKSQVGRYGSVDPAKPYSDSIAFARAIERAHGIGGGK